VKSGVEFKDFGSGLPHKWKGYKDWIYNERRRVLDFKSWRKPGIGKGIIIKNMIAAVVSGMQGSRAVPLLHG